MGGWVELRVHGVRATDPEDMLDIDRVTQVAGDELGRVFRRAGRDGLPIGEPDGHVVEAYHWGKLTSGSFAQALWLLLAPFGLVNAAQFTLPAPVGRARWHALAGAALRVVGLAMTALFVLTAAVLTVDLWAWQQGRAASGAPYVLALLGPAALLLGFWWAAGPPPPEVREAAGTPDPQPPARDPASELVRADFFGGTHHLAALRYLHIAAGLAVVAGVAGSVTAAPGWTPVLRGVAVGLVGTVALVAAFGVRKPDLATRRGERETVRLVAQALAVVAGAVALAAVVVVGAAPAAAGPGGLPGVDVAAGLVMVLAVAGIGLLALANAGLARTPATTGRDHVADGPDPFGPYARGGACTLLALLGLFLGVGYSGAFSTVVAAALTSPERPVVVPELLSRVAYAWGITAIGVLGLAGYLLVRRSRALRHQPDRVAADFRGALTARWARKVAAAMWAARLKNGLACVLGAFGALGVVLTAVAAVELLPLYGFAAVPLPWVVDVLSWWPEPGVATPSWQVAVLTLGTLTLTGLATGLILLARTALFGASARRGVNVVWDVIAFWPRAVHPFVPSAYSARAVADIEDRIRWHLREGGAERVAVCGHSQGSLLTFAALVRLEASAADRDLLGRIAYLTFGSQLRVMFARGFPAYVNRAAITGLYGQLGGAWRNLYRDTDPLAGPVLSWRHPRPDWIGDGPRLVRRGDAREEFGPDWRLLDPVPPVDRTLQRSALLPLRGHGEYWLDEAWYAALAEIGCGRVPGTRA